MLPQQQLLWMQSIYQVLEISLEISSASKDAYKKSFFTQTIRDLNVLPDSLISSAELSDDCVSKFTSLVRARD